MTQYLALRPGADDVIVLRKELVNAQTLMDDLTRSKEEEIDTLRRDNMTVKDQKLNLEAERERVLEEKNQLQAELDKVLGEKKVLQDNYKNLQE